MNVLEKPRKISKELADFLQLSPGELISRCEVNRAITAYIHFDPNKKIVLNNQGDINRFRNVLKWVDRLNPNGRNLQDPIDKRYVIPDSRLSTLLKYDEYVSRVKADTSKVDPITREEVQHTDCRLSYTVIQHLLSVHFLKDE